VINTAFGFGLYSALVWIGVNLFVAQILSHCTGVAFNYFMFRRHVFTSHDASIKHYIGAYILNYLMGLCALFVIHQFIPSPFIAGFLALLLVSVINFFILKHLVFTPRDEKA